MIFKEIHTAEEKQLIRKCVPADCKERRANGAFIIRDCPVPKCKFCLLHEYVEIAEWMRQ